jgi:hypothetical protein
MKRIELESMSDLAFLASSSHSGIIQHFQDQSENNFYYVIGGSLTETFVFFNKSEDKKKKFLNLDAKKNKITFTDLPIIDPKIQVIPIVDVKTQDVINF